MDGGLLDPEKVGSWADSPSHPARPATAHAYVHLAYAVTVPQHDALCRGLGAHLGVVDPRSHNDVLRPAAVQPQARSVRRRAGSPSDGGEAMTKLWDPRELAEVLGVTPSRR